MKKQGKGDPGGVLLSSSSTASSCVTVDHDFQMVAFKTHPGNVHATENGSHSRREIGRDGTAATSAKVSSVPDIICNLQEAKCSLRDEAALRNWMAMDSSSQVYSGPEDNSTDPHETLTETSTLTFVDAHIMEESAEESHSLHGVGMVYLKEFVLIDDDDDGDMSLREKTVTDLSVMDGKAADLVCGRLLSTSSCSLSECKDEFSAPEAPPPEDAEDARDSKPCCSCTVL